MKYWLFTILNLISYLNLSAQVAKTPIVEHFTNSNCGVCAYYNPGIYDTILNYPGTLRIAYYPSSPYAACIFSMQNPVDQDARTNFYNVYGSTPKLIVNGLLSTTANLPIALSAYSLDSTSFSMYSTQQFINPDSVHVRVVIKKEAADTLSQALLFAAAAEDTVFQTTANGETQHRDVFRKKLTAITGDLIYLPTLVGDSIILYFAYKIVAGWDAARMDVTAILQKPADQLLIQCARSVNVIALPTATKNELQNELRIYPNPSGRWMEVSSDVGIQEVVIKNLQGAVVVKTLPQNKKIDTGNLANGLYFIIIKTAQQTIVLKHQITN